MGSFRKNVVASPVWRLLGGRLVRLWKEKRGEFEPEDLSGDLLVQLGTVTEHLNRHLYEKNTGQVITAMP